eukprot:320845-Rhodomonas_salina.3
MQQGQSKTLHSSTASELEQAPDTKQRHRRKWQCQHRTSHCGIVACSGGSTGTCTEDAKDNRITCVLRMP